MKKIKIKFDSIYDYVEVNVLSVSAYNKKAAEVFPDDINAPIAFTLNSTVYLPKEQKRNIPLLVHELIHAVKYIMYNKNINDDEFLCYSVQYCLATLMKKLQIIK